MRKQQLQMALASIHPTKTRAGSTSAGCFSTRPKQHQRGLRGILAVAFFAFSVQNVSAQCPGGSTSATTNWDNLDYLVTTGTYAGFVTPSMRDTQRFTLGVNMVKIQILAGVTTTGENTTNTAETGSYGTGADVSYTGNGTVVLTFDTVVRNLQFSLYDIDLLQSAQVTAIDGAGTPVALNVTMSVVTAGVVTVVGSGTTTTTGTANNTALANNDTRGTLNVSIAGNSPAAGNGVKKVTITMGGTAGNFWMSDLTACVFGSFPLNYYAPVEPFTGQPAYYLVTPDNNSIYMFNPLTGVADWLFTEPVSPWTNSLAYDYSNKTLYYVMDNPSPVSTNKSLKKYDYNTETISTAVADVTTLSIPLFNWVVESAGAAFYNGSLFLGIEGTNSSRNSARESIVWRIDFNPSNVPYRASQVFARPADNGAGTLTHDWGDFSIKDGMLYNFNSGNQGSTAQFVHFNMQTGASVNYNTNGSPVPVQVGQTWNGNLYWTGGQSPETGRVAPYNENGTIGTKIVATVTACSPPWVGRAGDASDPFKPKSDFGDNPITYDPAGDDPATHQYDCNLTIGTIFDREWQKDTSFDATADGSDEDGITALNLLQPGNPVTFDQDINIYNNTGSDATLVAWLDYNGNGTFSVSEGISITIPSNSSLQTVTMTWAGINVPLAAGYRTFIRARLSSASNGLTTSSIHGWFANGEIEDYYVEVGGVMSVELLEFTADVTDETKVQLEWTSAAEMGFEGYEVQHSADAVHWSQIAFVPADGSVGVTSYGLIDNTPLPGTSYYRLKMVDFDGSYTYSSVVKVTLDGTTSGITISPNPVQDKVTFTYCWTNDEDVTVRILDAGGAVVLEKTMPVQAGTNELSLEEVAFLPRGIFIVQVAGISGNAQGMMAVE